MTTNKKNNSDEGYENQKIQDLSKDKKKDEGQFLTTNNGVRVNDDQNSLKAGQRGPTLMEDFHFREKMMHFDHERIPERVVHARGAGAHGYFETYESMSDYTAANFLQTPQERTPVFVRFSTVVGSKGSSDLARDARGFAVKFYTKEGNYDLVGNNIPVFFIQDAMKFPDLVHAIKPEPDHGMPQASAAHDTFWDFISLMPESMHMIMWVMSDRAIPRSFSMMEGFGVHTFKFVNQEGKSHFVKFHWKPKLGVHGVTWDEAQKISGNDPDFLRRDLWEAIEMGNFPTYELGVQMVAEEDEHNFNFDLLDPTKIIPEELVPVKLIGKLVLNKNPSNFFSETEQVAFHPGHLVPGIDFSNDPLLQGRLFSYLDTQLIRLGGPNFHEIPINRPIAPVHNNHSDGYMRQSINEGKSSYQPNQTGRGCPFQAAVHDGGFSHQPERLEGEKTKVRSSSFFDHYSQAKMFYDSQSKVEKKHIKEALAFELGKVEKTSIKSRLLVHLQKINESLAEDLSKTLGVEIPKNLEEPLNQSIPENADPENYTSAPVEPPVRKSEALSMENTIKDSIRGRNIAILVEEGVSFSSLEKIRSLIEENGAKETLISSKLGSIITENGQVSIDKSFATCASVLFDAVFVPDSEKSALKLKEHAEAIFFIEEMYKHCKAIGFAGEGKILWNATRCAELQEEVTFENEEGIFHDSNVNKFIEGVKNHRFWNRKHINKIPA
ncbi:catalase [Belliella sp. DSM 111904]|uniref:Catalase n=1 Tax=Belliella filtrata TaxID=2923435 RepID=A0ABS9V2E8_9BACT|nr:catalase [Belliella filtrata]MCH7410597.1 catalase [Belliella filtrata]